MFRSFFRQRFYSKNVQFLFVLFFIVGLQADSSKSVFDKKSRMQDERFYLENNNIHQLRSNRLSNVPMTCNKKLQESRQIIVDLIIVLQKSMLGFKENDPILLIDGYISKDQMMKKQKTFDLFQEEPVHVYASSISGSCSRTDTSSDGGSIEWLSGDSDDPYVADTVLVDHVETTTIVETITTEPPTVTATDLDTYYQDKDKEEEDEAAKREQDDADAKAYDDDQANLRKQEERAALLQEEIRQQALLEKYHYVFEIPQKFIVDLDRLQKARQETDARGIFTRMFYTRPEILEERQLQAQLEKNKEVWRTQALKKVEILEKEAQRKAKELEKAQHDKATMPGGGPWMQPDFGCNGFNGGALPPDKDKDNFRNHFHHGMNPAFHQRVNGIKMAEFRQILGLKDKEPKKTKEEKIKDANSQKWANRQQREKVGIEKEKVAAQQRAILAAAMQKTIDKAAANPKSVKAKVLKKAETVIENDRQRNLNDSKVDLLPQGPGGYQGKLTSNFTMPRDEAGAFIDRNDDRFHWDEKVEKWRKDDKKSKFICYVDPLKTAEDRAREKQRQEDFVQAQKITAAAVQESLCQFEQLQKQAEEKNKQPEKDNGKKDPKNSKPQGTFSPGIPGQTNPQLPSPIDVQTDFDVQDEFVDIVDAYYKHLSEQDMHDQLIVEQREWLENHNVGHASQTEQNMISDLQNAMIDPADMTVVEFAQAGLQAWVHAQNAATDEQFEYYKDQAQKLHDAVVNKNSQPLSTEQIESVQSAHIQELIQNYTSAAGASQAQGKPKSASSPMLGDKNPELEHEQRITTRLQALVESQKQIDSGQLIFQSHDISSQARGFMMANNINYSVFHPTIATSIQHALTQELIGIVEHSAAIGLSFHQDSIAAKIAHHTCNLAVAGQQLNEACQIEHATAITDLSHFFALYGKYVLNNEAQGKALYEVGAGVYDGTTQVLQKWATFFQELCLQPQQTMKTIATDCTSTGAALLNLAATLNEFSPLEYVKDIAKDMRQTVDRAIVGQPHRTATEQSAVGQRNIRNLSTLFTSLQAAQAIIQTMQEQSIRKNVADATQMYIQGVITGKIIENLAQVSALVGNEFIQAGKAIGEVVPPHLINSPFQIVTNAGQIAFVADGTGESIGAAIAAAGKQLSDPRFAKVVGQGVGGTRKAQENHRGNAGEETVKNAPPSWDNESINFFENLKKNATKEARSGRFGNFYKDPKTELWWSKDNGLHGGLHYKVFKETSRGFEHQYNADLLGNKIVGQHKGPVGSFISFKEIVFKS